MSKSSSASSGGLDLLGTLTVVLVILKLVGTIDWSWWWVLSPTLIPIAIALIILVIYLIVNLVFRSK